MSYLRIRKFWDYQNADAWKKSSQNKRGAKHPQWCKLYVYRDEALDQYPCHIRLVWFELLRLATANANVISNESQAIAKHISMPHKQVREAIDALVQGGWIQVTKTPRRSRNLSRENLETKPPKNRDRERTSVTTAGIGNLNTNPLTAVTEPTPHGFDGALIDLVRNLNDRDAGTINVIKDLCRKHGLGEGALRGALEAATSRTAISPTKVAIGYLKQQAQLKGAA